MSAKENPGGIWTDATEGLDEGKPVEPEPSEEEEE